MPGLCEERLGLHVLRCSFNRLGHGGNGIISVYNAVVLSRCSGLPARLRRNISTKWALLTHTFFSMDSHPTHRPRPSTPSSLHFFFPFCSCFNNNWNWKSVKSLLCYLLGFTNARSWLRDVREHADPHLTCILVGNKVDLCSDEPSEGDQPTTGSGPRPRQVPTDEAELWAKEEGLLFVEASAKSGTNVEVAFETATRDILDKIRRGVFDDERVSSSVLPFSPLFLFLVWGFGWRVGFAQYVLCPCTESHGSICSLLDPPFFCLVSSCSRPEDRILSRFDFLFRNSAQCTPGQTHTMSHDAWPVISLYSTLMMMDHHHHHHTSTICSSPLESLAFYLTHLIHNPLIHWLTNWFVHRLFISTWLPFVRETRFLHSHLVSSFQSQLQMHSLSIHQQDRIVVDYAQKSPSSLSLWPSTSKSTRARGLAQRHDLPNFLFLGILYSHPHPRYSHPRDDFESTHDTHTFFFFQKTMMSDSERANDQWSAKGLLLPIYSI